jgi:sarcosine oxidase subunit gamma
MRPGRYGIAGPPQVFLRRIHSGLVWNLQGVPDNPALIRQLQDLWGIDHLPQPHRARNYGAFQLLWIGPKSWLVFDRDAARPSEQAAALGIADFRDRIQAAGGALFDVSAGRVGWRVSGPRAQDLLASACALDLHPSVFRPDSCAQSLFGHVSALYHRLSEDDFAIHVARSFAVDVWEALCASAAQYGYEVVESGA